MPAGWCIITAVSVSLATVSVSDARGRRRWLPWLAVFVVALAARWAYAASLPPGAPIWSVDAQGYHALALNLLNGHGFSLNTAAPFLPDAIRTPLYPLLVAAVYAVGGPEPAHVAWLQGLLDAVTALVIGSVVGRLAGRGWWAWAAGGLYALSPTAWRFSNELLTETVLAALLAWLLWAFVRWTEARQPRWLALAASLAAAALLVKPNVVLLPALLAAAVGLFAAHTGGWWARLGPALAVLALAAVLVSPWLVRNRITFGRWLFSHAFDNNLARVSAVATLARAHGERVAPWTPRWEALYSGLLLEAEARFPDFAPVPRTAPEADRTFRQLAVVAGDIIRAHPLDFAVAHLSGFARSWVPQEHRYWYERLSGASWASLGSEEGVFGKALARLRATGPISALAYVWRARFGALPPLALALWLGWLAAYAIAALLLLRGTGRWRHLPVVLCLVWGTILYVTFLPGPIADIRFRAPVAPLLVVIMALGVAPCQRRDSAASKAGAAGSVGSD